MEATISMKQLWQTIQTLPLNNQKWLSERLIERIEEEEDDRYISKAEVLAGIDAGLKDVKAGRTRPVEELLKELDDECFN